MKACTIIFDRPYNTYFAGQTVNGRIEFVLKKSKKIRGILLIAKGESNISWKSNEATTSEEATSSKNVQVNFSGKQEYFRFEQYCFGNKDVGEGSVLDSGKHVYPFSFILPPNIPSSYEGQYGYVRYTIKVILQRHYYGAETKTAFSVIAPFDLNLYPNLREGNEISNEKDLKMAWWSIGPIYYCLKIMKSGYVPGEDMLVRIVIDNNTSIDITGIDLKLQQTVTYTSQTPTLNTKTEEFILEKIKLGSLAGQKSDSWAQIVNIPPCPPSGLNDCALIGIEYDLLLGIVVNYKMFRTLKLVLPIKIGTEPLKAEPSAGNSQNIPESPPDYEMAVYGLSKLDDTEYYGDSRLATSEYSRTKRIKDSEDTDETKYCNETKEFSPYYLVYDFNNNLK